MKIIQQYTFMMFYPLLIIGAGLIFLGKSMSYIYFFTNKEILNREILYKLWTTGIKIVLLAIFTIAISGLIHIFITYFNF